MPALNGRSIYAGRDALDCVAKTDRIAKALEAGDVPIRVRSLKLNEVRARKLVARIPLKTINRDLAFLADWGQADRGKWMESDLPP